KRSCPRSSTSWVTGNGSSLTNSAPFLPVKKAASVCSVPRAMVPSICGRALDPFEKNALARSGRYFGWLGMSCRQPAAATGSAGGATAPPKPWRRRASPDSVFDFIDLSWSERLQELERPRAIELRIVGFDGQEELVLAGACERRHVEHRVI